MGRRSTLVAILSVPTVGSVQAPRGIDPNSRAVCSNVCEFGDSICSSETASELLLRLSDLPLMSLRELHMVGSWSATAFPAQELLPLLVKALENQTSLNSLPTAALLHGATRQAMWAHQMFFNSNATIEYILGLINTDIATEPLFSLSFAHGVGQGAAYAAAVAPSNVSCMITSFGGSRSLLENAESTCTSLPTRSLSHMCAVGLFSAFFARELAYDTSPEDSELVTTVDGIVNAELLKFCDDAIFFEACVVKALDRIVPTNRLADMLVEHSGTCPHLFLPKDGAIDELCPPSRWPDPKQRRGCVFGASAQLVHSAARVNNARCGTGKFSVPLAAFTELLVLPNFAFCRPKETEFTLDAALRAQACVSGSFHISTMVVAHNVYGWLASNPNAHATNCRDACDTLRFEPNLNLRSAITSCRQHAICQDLREWLFFSPRTYFELPVSGSNA